MPAEQLTHQPPSKRLERSEGENNSGHLYHCCDYLILALESSRYKHMISRNLLVILQIRVDVAGAEEGDTVMYLYMYMYKYDRTVLGLLL